MTGPSSAPLRRFHPSVGSAARLVCFPHAGGAASYYFALAEQLRASFDVDVAQYPGRERRLDEPPVRTVDELADEVAPALADGDDTQPVVLFGHSMGAVVAFEVARRLTALGRPPRHLVVSACQAPDRLRTDYPRDRDLLLAEVRQSGGTDPAIFDTPELLEWIAPVIVADYAALCAYTAPADGVTCPLTAIGAVDDPDVPVPDVLAWQNWTTARFDTVEVTGGHFYLARSDEPVRTLRSLAT